MNITQKVVIVGGGFAGVKAALELANNPHFEVILLTPHSRFEYHGAMYRSATGRSPLEVVIPMSVIFANINNVTVLLDSMVELRPETGDVEGESGRTYSYDTLVMAVGYEVNFFGIPGMAAHAESMYDISGAIKLRHRLVGTFRKSKPGVPIRINVIGAGATGVEIVADIKNFAKIVEGRHALHDLDIHMCLIEAADRVLPGLSPKSSQHALDRLEELGIEVLLNTRVTQCAQDNIKTTNGTLDSDVTIWTAGNKAHALFGEYPDVFEVDAGGRVKVNDFLQSKKENIYVIGDAASTPYSGLAQTAIHNAIALSDNLKRVVAGESLKPYQPKLPTYVVPIGGEWAILESRDGIKTGLEGWQARLEADRWVLGNFLVYELANKHHMHGERIANF